MIMCCCLAVINYEITVVTGNVTFAGTNAKVVIQIFGEKGKTEIITLESRSNNYERNVTEIFKVPKTRSFKYTLSLSEANPIEILLSRSDCQCKVFLIICRYSCKMTRSEMKTTGIEAES